MSDAPETYLVDGIRRYAEDLTLKLFASYLPLMSVDAFCPPAFNNFNRKLFLIEANDR